jgi:hypothetical protein
LASKNVTRPSFNDTCADAWPASSVTLSGPAFTVKRPLGVATAISDAICARAGSSTPVTWMMDSVMAFRRSSFTLPESGLTSTPVGVDWKVPAKDAVVASTVTASRASERARVMRIRPRQRSGWSISGRRYWARS